VGGFSVLVLFLWLLWPVLTRPAPAPAPAAQATPQPKPPPRTIHEPPPATEFPGLLGYWPLDEGAGDTAGDVSGNNPPATLIKADWTKGVRGNALEISGAGSFLEYGASPKLNFANQAPFTICAWVRTERRDGTILSQRNRRDEGADFDVTLAGGRLFVALRADGTGAGFPAEIAGRVISDGEWHHFAVTRDVANTMELFVDGDTQGRSVARGAVTTDLRTLGSERYWVTIRRGPGNPDFQGSIDEFCIFDRPLTLVEIRRLAGC
jgi:Concanavalin A-like lectin/glucanases superfamily